MIGQTFGNMRNKICLELLQNQNIIKALIVDDKDFLDTTLDDEQQKYLDNPNGKIIICHLGSGASITAVKDQKLIIDYAQREKENKEENNSL